VTMADREKRCAENSDIVVEEVVLGVDTHLDVHVAVALDGLGVGAWENSPCPQPRGAMRASSLGWKASARCSVQASRAPAATALGSPAT
jgi:hypothetical protein